MKIAQCVGLLALVVLGWVPSAFASDWEQIFVEDGITVWKREVAGTSLVEFRGRGVIPASVKKILAVLYDSKRKTEWMQNCVASERIRTIGPGQSIFYNRTGSNFPLVADRDVVAESAVTIWREKGQAKVELWSVEDPAKPEIDGVVRMPKLVASWILIAKDDGHTEVTYQVQADPGGSLPQWVVNIVAKKIPFHTIQNLGKQANKPGYDEEIAYVERSFTWDGFGTPQTGQTPSGSKDM